METFWLQNAVAIYVSFGLVCSIQSLFLVCPQYMRYDDLVERHLAELLGGGGASSSGSDSSAGSSIGGGSERLDGGGGGQDGDGLKEADE